MAEEASRFLMDKLRPDLEAATRRHTDLLDSLRELRELRETVRQLRHPAAAATGGAAKGAGGGGGGGDGSGGSGGSSSGGKYKQLVDIGAEHFVEAEATDTEFIFLKVGLGFFVQVTLDEAPPIIDQQEEVLKKKIQEAVSKVEYVKAHIAKVQAALVQLHMLA